MLSKGIIKKTAYVTLIFFACLVLNGNFAFPQSEDVFAAVKTHMQQGDYDTAVSMLNQFIEKNQDVKGQEKNLANAHYLLAKLYFLVSEADEKIDENIRKTFEHYPGFKQDEEDMFFRERVEKIRNKLLEERKIEEPVAIEEKELEPVEKEEEIKDNGGIIEGPIAKHKKKKKFPILLVVGGAIVVTALVFLLAKKSKKYTLTVNRDDGVDGSPPTGSHIYKKGETVNYNFTQKSGYRNLVVTLDGNAVAASGSIVMDRDHTLRASTTKIGRINSVSVKFTVRFAATNLKVRHRVWIDHNLKIDEILNFRVHSSDKWEDAVKIYRTFTVTSGPNLIRIQQEAGPYYSSSYSRDDYYWIWGTYYELEIINYTYIDGVDPGWPTLSEELFYLYAAPWIDDPNDEWYRIKVKEITINPPSVTSKKQSKEMANQKLKGGYNQ